MNARPAASPLVLIAGAGIGGLTAALALLRAGFAVRVFEQAAALGEVGAGVQISANGTRALFALGLEHDLRAVAWEPQGKEVRLWNTGDAWPLFDLGIESVKRYGFPYLMFHRADLHDALAAAVRKLDPGAIVLGARCEGCDEDRAGVTLRLAGGETVRGDALIGADGVHSTIRRVLFGPDQPKFTGLMAWRGVVPTTRVPPRLRKPVGTSWVGPGGHIVHYFLRRGELLNFVGVRERSDWTVESWSIAGTVEECLADFSGWHADIRALIRSIATPYKWALLAREPMQRWCRGRIGLLGDACHPMLPFLAQGAVMAIEDAYALAACLAEGGGDIPAALAGYERERLERTTRAVLGSAANTALFHSPMLAGGDTAARFVAENGHPDRNRARYEWLFTHDVTRRPNLARA